jgi:hypothetical protein
MNRYAALHREELKRVSDKYPPIKKPINQLVLGAPKGMKFKTVAYLFGRYTRICPWKFEEIPYLQYISYSRGHHTFLACGDINYIIICKEI